MSGEKHHILYVDDEEHNLNSFQAAFRKHFHIHTARSAREGLGLLREHPVAVIVTDQRMPEMTGVQFLEAVIAEYPDPIRMVLTGFSDIEAIIRAINTGRVFRYITKPWDEKELKMTLDGAAEFYGLQQKNRALVEQLHAKVLEQQRIMDLFGKYVPKHVVEATLKASADDEDNMFDGESRVISILFADLRNFTEIAEEVEPRTVVSFLNDYFGLMSACVRRHGGTVNKFIGDEILAIFGAPISSIQNQENAVLCAIEMRAALAASQVRYRETFGREIAFGIGINSGDVIAGNIGSEDRVEYTVIGDSVNVAKRIESLTHTQPNAILISDSTARFVRDRIELRALPPVEIRGHREPIVVHEVIGVRE
jgi:class 3 adenylate cyclase